MLTLRKFASNWLATALANRVLPVPGGPYNKQPLGGVIPTRWNSSGLISGNSITYNYIQHYYINSSFGLDLNQDFIFMFDSKN